MTGGCQGSRFPGISRSGPRAVREGAKRDVALALAETLAQAPRAASPYRAIPAASLARGQKKSPAPSFLKMPGKYLAATYSHRTCRPNTIGAAAFHFRVRNGTGWFHRALATRGRPCSIRAGTLEV